MPPQPPRGGPRQRLLPTPRGVNMIVWSLDNRFVLAAIMGTEFTINLNVSLKENVFLSQKLNQVFFFLIGKFLSPLGLEPGTSHKSSPFLYHLS